MSEGAFESPDSLTLKSLSESFSQSSSDETPSSSDPTTTKRSFLGLFSDSTFSFLEMTTNNMPMLTINSVPF